MRSLVQTIDFRLLISVAAIFAFPLVLRGNYLGRL